MYKILSSSPCNSRLELALPRSNCSSPLCYLSATWSSKSQLNLSSLCAHLDCSLEACVLRSLLPLDPRGTEWPAKIKTQFPTPLIESHTPWFSMRVRKLIIKPQSKPFKPPWNKWIYPTTPRTCRFRVIEVGVRCFWACTSVPCIFHCTSRSHFSLLSKQARQAVLLHSSDSTHSLCSTGYCEDFQGCTKKKGGIHIFQQWQVRAQASFEGLRHICRVVHISLHFYRSPLPLFAEPTPNNTHKQSLRSSVWRSSYMTTN